MPLTPLSSRPWRLARADPIPVDAQLDDPDCLSDWLPARVPGSIQRDLMAAGRLPDLHDVLDLDEALRWVDESDWWYETELPAIGPGQRAWIDFGGIDYMAAVTVDGRELERRAGMFSRRRYEITDSLQKGTTSLGVRIWGAWALPGWPRTPIFRFKRWVAEHFQTNLQPFDDRLLSLKSPVHFGWDFSPRLMTAGIWDDAWLHVTGEVAISDLWVRADWGPDEGLVLHLELDALREMPVSVELKLTSVRNNDDVQVENMPVVAYSGASSVALRWPDARLQPWSTWDRGYPNRYQLAVTLRDDEGAVLDERMVTVGARRFGWHIEEGVWHPVLNGQPLRFRGANWVPLDLLPGDENEEARYRALLQKMVEAGVNAIRVWGGGGRERPVFYDLCDELGLLVWQEMPVACVFLEYLPQDKAFVQPVRQETTGIIRSLRQHPSIFMWAGGNEWGPGRFGKVARAMSQVACRTDPSRRWLPASPGPHDSHNWQVWHGFASPELYASDPAPLLSEFGLAAPPDVTTLRRILPEEGLWPPGPAWEARKAELSKLRHYADLVGGGDDLDDFVAASQEAQARGLQTGVEAYRVRADSVGSFIWQWNEPWPAISWAVIPYDGAPKRAWQQLARSYAPLAPIARLYPDHIELWLVNDTLTSPGVCQLTAVLSGHELWAGEVTPPANGRILVQSLPMPEDAGLLTLHLTGPGVDARNDYPLPWPFERSSNRLHTRLEARALHWLLRW